MRRKHIAIVIAICILVGVGIYLILLLNSNSKQTQNIQIPSPAPTQQPMTVQKPTRIIDTKKSYTALLKTTQGNITISLEAAKTPITVNNFVYLARQHFYDNTIFHRVISGFMIQGGDPLGTGSGGPGYTFDDEPFEGFYTRGTVAMANAGPNTNGSQFFIMHKDYDLPKNYVIFGHVTAGIDVVDAIASSPVTTKNGENSSPQNPVVVETVEITEK